MVKPAGQESPVLALFDLDGTLTKGDSLWRFLIFCGGRRKVAAAAIRRPFLALAGTVLPALRAQELKDYLIRSVLGQMTEQEVEEKARAFIQKVLRNRINWPVVSQLLLHKSLGHYVVVVSASPDLYVKPFAFLLGADEVLCTKTRRDGESGWRLASPNNRGAQKAEAVRQLIKRLGGCFFIYAYGNSSNDSAMLRLADAGINVSRAPLLPLLARAPKSREP